MKLKKLLTIAALSGMTMLSASANAFFGSNDDNVRLGYLVKQPEEPWFQTEWSFAEKAAKQYDFELVKMAVPDGEKTLNAIDTLAASGAKGFVICTPDPKLGPAIMAKAKSYDLKVITVDDQFLNAKGEPMKEVPLVMMAASEIGYRQGSELFKEMTNRGWDAATTGVMAITADELDTANSLLVQYPKVKQWLIVGMNDNTVLGGVRATEGQGFAAENVIGIGINGVDAVNELAKSNATGFFGSLLPSPDVHGFKSIESLYKWVKEDVQPEKFVEVTDVVLITRDNFREELQKKGL
ncbi:substrate-binding domain-containing protein [Vibrio parahaemolyticus]